MTYDPLRPLMRETSDQFFFGRRFKWTSAFASILDAMREARAESRPFCPIFF
jgi:hypothetical protein